MSVTSEQETNTISVTGYWARIRERRWWLMLSLFLTWALVMAGSWFLTPKYRSETVILIEQQQVPESYVAPNINVDLQQRLQSMSEQILSRTRLLGVIDKFHLYGGESSKNDPDALVERMRKDIGIDLIRSDDRARELSAFKISYSAPTAQLAQQVTNELTSLFIQENLRTRAQLSENTTAFLENQLTDARTNLSQQEEKLRQFKSEYLGELPEQLQGNLQILAGLQSRLQGARDALNTAEQQRLYLQSLLDQYRNPQAGLAAPASGGPAAPPTIDAKLESMKTELAQLSAQYTPQHPDVVRLKEQIAATEKLKAQMDADAKAGKAADGSDASAKDSAQGPVAQLEGQLKANQLEITNRKNEIQQLQKQMDEYQSRLNLTPVREQQLAALTRDHEQSSKYYESLLAKKQQSEMATDLEKRQQGEQFRMIDPPSLPVMPYFPNRLLISGAGVAVGLVVGLALIVVLEFFGFKIYLEEDLRDLQPIPVLVELPPVRTAAEVRRSRRYRWGETTAASLLILIIPLVTLLVYLKG